jgi:hypothetical protein
MKIHIIFCLAILAALVLSAETTQARYLNPRMVKKLIQG